MANGQPYRRMAQDTINKAIAIGKLPNVACKTKNLQIHGAMESLDKSQSFIFIWK